MGRPKWISGRPAPTFAALAAQLRDDVKSAAGVTPPDLRERVLDDSLLADELWTSYVGTVRAHSYRIVDQTFDDLREQGCSDDAIYEVTVAAAVGAAGRQLEAALRACRSGGA